MNCVEFERILPEFLEGSHTSEQQAHLSSCSACSNLLADLNTISVEARTLLASEEPSPAVWKALEERLRSEGLIRRPQPMVSSPRRFTGWRMAWLVPALAALAIVASLRLYHPASLGDKHPIAKARVTPPAPVVASAVGDDQQLLNTVSARPPAQLAAYRADLDNANSFIRDAEQSAKDDPDDAYTQQLLINAYEQKQMLYELAVDHSTSQ